MSIAFSRIDASQDEARSWMNDFGVRLSREEIGEFLDEQWEFIMRWMQRSRDLAQSDDGIARHTYYSMMFGAPLEEVLGAEVSADRPGAESSGKRQ